jgi:hypothetical protein
MLRNRTQLGGREGRSEGGRDGGMEERRDGRKERSSTVRTSYFL